MAEKDYIFISYKGEDPQALKIIHRLQDEGYRIWYDQRTRGGADWLKDIADHLRDCGYFITIFTEAFISSDWCTNELLKAQKLGKPILPLVLTELPDEFDMITISLKRIERQHFADDEAFYKAIRHANGIQPFRDPPKPAQKPMKPRL